MTGRKVLALFLLILALGALLRFHRIGDQSLWDDEISTIDYTAQSIGEMWRDLPHRDANPPLFYIVFHFWRELGESELAYRSLTAIFGVIALALSYLVAVRLADRRTALLAMLLLAVNPLSVYCAQETRAHTILLTLGLLSVLFFIRLMEYGRARDLAGWVAATTLAVYTHYFAFFLIIAQVICAAALLAATRRASSGSGPILLRLGTIALNAESSSLRQGAVLWACAVWSAVRLAYRRLLYFAVGLAMIAVLYLPWLKAFLLQIVRGQGWRPYQPPWEILGEMWIYLTVGHAAIRHPGFVAPLEGMQDGGPEQVLRFTLILLAILIPFAVLLFAGIPAWKREGHRGRLLVLSWALVPVIVLLAVTQKVHIFDYRHMLPFTPPMAMLAAASLVRLGRRCRLAFALAAVYICILPVISLAQYYNDPAFAKQDWRGAYRMIRDASRPGDVILTYHPKKALGLVYYSDGAIPIAYVVPEGYTERTIEEQEAAMAGRVVEVMDAHPRIWLMDYHGLVFDRLDVTRRTLRGRYHLAFERAFQKGPRRYTIELYTADFEEAAASYLGHVDFAEMDHSPGQLLSGWHVASDQQARWMAERAEVLLRNTPDTGYAAASFYAYYPFLGERPFEVALEVEGRPVGSVTVDAEGMFEVGGPIPDDLRGARFVRAALVSGAWFRPCDHLDVADTTHKSLLVMRIALEEGP